MLFAGIVAVDDDETVLERFVISDKLLAFMEKVVVVSWGTVDVLLFVWLIVVVGMIVVVGVVVVVEMVVIVGVVEVAVVVVVVVAMVVGTDMVVIGVVVVIGLIDMVVDLFSGFVEVTSFITGVKISTKGGGRGMIGTSFSANCK